MLTGLANFSMQGRWQAAMVIAAMSLMALAIPPVSYLASGIIALGTLRAGPKEGITVVAIVTIVFAIAATFLLNQPHITGLFLISSWLPVYGVTLILGYSRSLAVSLLVTAGIGLLLVVGAYIVLPDPAAWWLQMMGPFVEMLQAQPDWKLEQAETESFVAALSSMMTGLIFAGLFTNVVLGLLLGRAWQADLYNQGGFAEEFQQLQLGKGPAIITVAVVLSALLPGTGFAIMQDCLPILLVLFAVQGVAVVHAVVRLQQKHKAWLIVMYILLLVMMPQMVFLLALIGVLEQWFNFRQRSVEHGE
jgi:hypothetical protein